MQHTRPTIRAILSRIAELEKSRKYWTKRALDENNPDQKDAEILANQNQAAINELKYLINEK